METKLYGNMDEKICIFNINDQQIIPKRRIDLEIQNVCGVTGKSRAAVGVILVYYVLQLW